MAPQKKLVWTKSPVPTLHRQVILENQERIHQAVKGAFASLRKQALAKLHAQFGKVQKADDEEVEDILDDLDPADFVLSLDLEKLLEIANGEVDGALYNVTADAAQEALALLGVRDKSDLIRVNVNSNAAARDRAAELVGMKWDGDELIPNPNAEWQISDTTREMLRNTIADALEAGVGIDGMAEAIGEAYAFSDERSLLIARTETIRAHNSGLMVGYRHARDDVGLNLKKFWNCDDEACDECKGNQDEGPIDLDDDFPSGDDSPPAHPNCECVVLSVVGKEEDDDDDGDENSGSEDDEDDDD